MSPCAHRFVKSRCLIWTFWTHTRSIRDSIWLDNKLGMGPFAVSRRIEKAFGDDSLTRQSNLVNIYDSFQWGTSVQRDRRVIKECQNMPFREYWSITNLTLNCSSQSPVTQVETVLAKLPNRLMEFMNFGKTKMTRNHIFSSTSPQLTERGLGSIVGGCNTLSMLSLDLFEDVYAFVKRWVDLQPMEYWYSK